jgi:hypothetical protein
MPAGKEVQPECISQRASSGRLNCSCSRSRDLTAINPVVPEMMKIAALAVSTAPGGNMSFAFSKSVPIAPAKGRGKRTPAWTNRRAKALVPCGFADAKTAKGILQYQNSRKRLSNCPRIPREEVRKYGSFQSGAKYGIYRYEQPPLAKQGIVLKPQRRQGDAVLYRHFTEVCPILLYGKLLHLLVDQPLFFFRNVKLHLYISLSVFHFRTAFRYKGLGLSQQAFSANGYSFAVLAIYSIPPPKGGICCAFL